MGIGPQRFPLFMKQVLHKAVKPDGLLQRPAGFPQGIRIPVLQFFLPGVPGFSPMGILQCHKQGKIRQPITALPGKRLQSLSVLKTVIGQTQNLIPVVIQQAEVHPVLLPVPGNGLRLPFFQQSLFHQQFQIDQIGIAGERRAGLIGRVSETGRCQRQDLPLTLPGFFQKVHEGVGLLSHRAHPIRSGQTGYMHQYAAFAHARFSLQESSPGFTTMYDRPGKSVRVIYTRSCRQLYSIPYRTSR